MTEPGMLLLELVVAVALIMGLLAAATAAVANRKWPQRSVSQITTFTVFALVVGFFVLTIGWMLWFMSAPCPEDSVCDAGAMAAAGVIMFGAIDLIAAIAVGGPVAYLTVRAIRAR
jgi:uncharacterized membrane protein